MITGDKTLFRWSFTEQRAFEDAKKLVHDVRLDNRRPISYAKYRPQVWMISDGCATGVARVVSLDNRKNAHVAAFYSAKLNAAQRKYPVHEIEMLAGVETVFRHRDVLQLEGVHLKDHKELLDQKKSLAVKRDVGKD